MTSLISVPALCRSLLAAPALLAFAPAIAQETITYTYDARGRLVTVNHGSTGPNANIVSSYKLDAADNRCNVTVTTNGIAGTGSCSGFALAPTSLPGGTVGTAYPTTNITASGGTAPYTYAASGSLPSGLNLTGSGVLSGTPTTAGTYSFAVTATDSASKTGSQTYTVVIGTGGTIQLASTDNNLRTVANAHGYTGSPGANYTFVVGSGVTITGTGNGGTGIDTGGWPSDSTLKLTVNGTVRGGGGDGGQGGSSGVAGQAGAAGGDAIRCTVPITITVNSGGTIQGGGGGGGGGGGTGNPYGGGYYGGGGGGGGAPNGIGASGGMGSGGGTDGTYGSSGTTSVGGAGGSGGTSGGSGGNFGQAGVTPTTSPYGAASGAGGAAGYAVRKNGTGCTASGAGTITGTVG